MMDLRQLADETGFQGYCTNASFFIRESDYKIFIEHCRTQRVMIVGVEGFHVCDRGIMPDTSAIADFSSLITWPWEKALPQSHVEAEMFFKKISAGEARVFDVSLMNETEFYGTT